jgi:hypothetical protein
MAASMTKTGTINPTSALEQRSDFFRGVTLRISSGFRHFTLQNGV